MRNFITHGHPPSEGHVSFKTRSGYSVDIWSQCGVMVGSLYRASQSCSLHLCAALIWGVICKAGDIVRCLCGSKITHQGQCRLMLGSYEFLGDLVPLPSYFLCGSLLGHYFRGLLIGVQ